MTDFVADFFGSPSMNLVAGEIVARTGPPCFRSPQFSLALPERVRDGAARSGDARHPARAPAACSAAPAAGADLDLPVRLVEPLGKDTLLYFDIGAERPFIAVSEGLAMAEMEAGDRVALTLTRDRLFLFAADGGGSPAAMQEARRRCGRNSPAREVERGRNSSRWRGSQVGP